jgi:formylglycine-generating enzyme required for sulfatase activity
MKKALISFFTLLLFTAAMTITAQAAKPKLAVFVVGIDDWKRGDVIAHIVGEELNRDKSYQVVTRSGAVQVKLKKLRRSGSADACQLREWGIAHGVAYVCLITTPDDHNFSAQLFDVSNASYTMTLCSGSSFAEGLGAVDLKELAWSLTGQLRSGCTSGCVPACAYREPSIGLDMVYVAGGKFTIGCLSGRDNINGLSCSSNEHPATEVEVGSFWIGKYEITQGQWEAVMGTTIRDLLAKYNAEHHTSKPLYGEGANYPMYCVTGYEAYAFCDTLSARTGKKYRLPTEAEFEYAARGGNSCSSKGYMYSGSNDVNEVSWYSGGTGTHVVGTKKGNELGIHDMSGNVWEWCGSKFARSYSGNSLFTVLAPPADTAIQTVRSSSWAYPRSSYRAAARGSDYLYERYIESGFRVV